MPKYLANTKRISRTKKITLGFIFFLSITPFLSVGIAADIDLLILVMLFILWRFSGYNNIPRKLIYVGFIVFFMIFVQGIIYGGLNLSHLIKYPLFFVLTPFFIYRLYGVKAFKIAADFVLISSIISLPFWILQNISPTVDNTLVTAVNSLHQRFPYDSWPRSMIIYTIGLPFTFMDELGLYRNSSLFNEPGKFAFWINYAITVYLIHGDKILSRKIIFLLGLLITTFSTGGYLQFFVIALTYFLASSSYNTVVRYALLSGFLLVSLSQYQRLEFLQPKVEEHFETQQDLSLEGSRTTGRFLRLRKGINAIKNYPILGRGISTGTQVESTYSSEYIGNVGGFIGFTARYGIPLSFLFFMFFYKGMRGLIRLNRHNTLITIGFFSALMLAFIAQGTAIWNPFILLFFIHGYLKYDINYMYTNKFNLV